MTKDLGTYFVKVELENGDGFIHETNTGWRYTHGRGNSHPLDADPISPTWEDEQDLINTMTYMFLEGNFSCDCNKTLFLRDAHQLPDLEDDKIMCGDELTIKRLTLITPNRTERVLYENN